ncbi:MAG: 30S ribosomal protein S12 methylthiotransferase RimO [Myxococcales bacterium]|nr:MAG: 30S ribosomal protein S12 methylthiotransferase RimO [Myxococcales bacterium]
MKAGKKIFLAPLGCPKNQIDGELMLARAVAAGHEIVSDPDNADVLVVNTCAFIEQAREESIDTILRLAELKAAREGRKLVVTGCMAERYGKELAVELPEIDALVGTGALDRINDAIDATRVDGPVTFLGNKHYLPAATMDRIVTERDGSAYVKVSEGCDHDCSFCVIPAIRGRHESRPVEDVALEVEGLVQRGVVEVNLVAQDLSAYGRDLGERQGLAALLYRLGRIESLARVRCFYLYPNTLSDEALEAMDAVDNVCAYIDMPLQHADPIVLRAMRRARGADQLRRIIDRIRTRVREPYMRSTFITGFPGETDEAFANLCAFVSDVRFDRVGVFTYSREEGSAAADLPDPVPADVAELRRDELIVLQEPISEELLAARVGKRERVLVCGRDETGTWYGRTEFQAPEIDGVTFLGCLGGDLSPCVGRVVEATLTGSDAYDLFGECTPAAAIAAADTGRNHPTG